MTRGRRVYGVVVRTDVKPTPALIGEVQGFIDGLDDCLLLSLHIWVVLNHFHQGFSVVDLSLVEKQTAEIGHTRP